MITYAMLSKVGGRKINEDSVGVSSADSGMFCVLADGLGGHSSGEVASKLAVDTALRIYKERMKKSISDEGLKDMLSYCMNGAQNAILDKQESQRNIREMKTTAVMLHIQTSQTTQAKNAAWAHIGDSRLYRFDNSNISDRTLDHSVPQMLALQGEIEEKDIRNHEDRNRLTRVMGIEWETPKFTISKSVGVTVQTTFLLCSDGFWELIEDEEMCCLLKESKTPEEWLAKMEIVVLKAGEGIKMDNYSAIAVFVR
ncbi:MAG: protein phosphatase 2C domain-containing protein [Oscillospiraceae bacterium]|jgi:serine/threonine protein phosphatase PrpC|nr:protein phosphatase 2C domain-containing protein [Oscillospiraceae bacterium]